MPKEWFAKCKDCGEVYGYSDDSNKIGAQRGLSRPERCPKCRKLHSREITTIGLSHFDLTPLLPIPASGLNSGKLGGLIRPARIHEAVENKPQFDIKKFGIKDTHIEEYFQLILDKQVTIIVAPTGAGKSTFLPYRLMVPPKSFSPDLFSRNGQIVITQPRIQATRNIPLFVARDLHGSNLGAGFDVGFRHSGNPSTDWRNKLVYMTDGTLINIIIRNELGRISVIMIDEAHERSLNIDLILGLLKLQLSRYPNLKLVIASATINASMFLEYFGGPKGFDPDEYATDSGEGFLTYNNKKIKRELKNHAVGFYGFPGKRQYPVETRFYEGEPIPEVHWAGRMPEEMAKKILEILHNIQSGEEPNRGDILGFLHGEAPIEKAVELVKNGIEEDHTLSGKVTVLPLYTKLPQKQQDLALLPKKNNKQIRVVISTNVAETSLTVDGIVHVVDSGLINEAQWDSKTQTSFVIPKIHSQSGCKQRWGRGGRIQAGIAHCLYTKDQFDRFPKFTDPEILRASLDQIVLTAKAAGVDNINNFNWIQNPSKEELDRAPRYLQQIGAVDKDGDLTDHGLELRNFGDEVDIANLMILADRFGCAVEMATVLPMRRLGNYTSLLIWDKSWDAASKRDVHKIHQGFIEPCLDDLEFSLKIWAAWENASISQKQQQIQGWSKRYFINAQVLKEEIAPERESLLNSLSGHKKDQVYRPIDFNLLTRLRILIAYGLPNQIYLLNEVQKGSQDVDQLPTYRPHIPDTERKQGLELLHEDATVELSSTSICANRALEAFVCGKRQRIRRRMSPLSDPLTVITASYLVLIKPRWLNYLNQPIMTLVRTIAEETRKENGDLIETINPYRLFLDQYYPIGSTFNCKKTGVSNFVDPYEMVAPAPAIHPRRSNEDIDVPIDSENLESERKIRSTGISKEDSKYIVDVEEGESVVNWLEDIGTDPEDNFPHGKFPDLPVLDKTTNRVMGKIVYSPPDITETKLFKAVVSGFDLKIPEDQIILLGRPSVPSSFDIFSAKYKVGARIQAQVTSIEQYVNDRLVYLVAREKATGLEIILDPYDASIGGRNFVINQISIGATIDATVEWIDLASQRVRVTCLQEAEAELLKFIGRGGERILNARIVEVRDNGLYLWIDPANQNIKIPLSSFIYIDRLPQRPEEMWLGSECKVKVNPQPRKNGYRRGLGDLPDEDLKLIKKFSWSSHIQFDEESRSIFIKGRMSYQQRVKLLGLSSNGEYQKSINILFRRSNELDARIIDMSGVENLSKKIVDNKPQKWHVARVLDNAVIVRNEEGFEVPVPKSESDFDRNVELKKKFKEGKSVKVNIKKVDTATGEVVVSLKDSTKDPLNKYKIGQIVKGVIEGWANDGSGLFLRVAPGVEGYVYKDHVAFESIKDVQAVCKLGQKVIARIIELDIEKHKMRLSIYGVYMESQFIPVEYISMVIGKEGNIIRRIENETLARINLNQDGVCEISGPNRQIVKKAKDKIGEILDTCVARFMLGEFQARKLIGRSGENIKNIQAATNTQIHVDKSNQVTVVAPSKVALSKSLALIKKSVVYHKVTIRIPSSRMGLVIGAKGSTIQKIQSATNIRIDIPRDNSGVIYLEGNSDEDVDKAMGLIRSLAVDLETISVDQGLMPTSKDMTLLNPKKQKTKVLKGNVAANKDMANVKRKDLKAPAGKKNLKTAKKKLSQNKAQSKMPTAKSSISKKNTVRSKSKKEIRIAKIT